MKRKNFVVLDGKKIRSIVGFHTEIAWVLHFPGYHGKNLDALWDLLSWFINTNLKLIWKDHAICRQLLGADFDELLVEV